MAYGILLLRVAVGLAFFGHGTQKLFGWFGGYGPTGTAGFFASRGYRYPMLMVLAAALSEAGGGTLLALGFLTPVAGALLATVMLNAIVSVTLKRAFMLGSELEIAYLVTAVSLAADPAFSTNVERVRRRGETDRRVQAVFGATDEAALTQKLAAADIAFARVNDTASLARHPHLRRIEVGTPSGPVSYAPPAARSDGETRRYRAVPALGEHTDRVWAEFLPGHSRPRRKVDERA